MQDFALFSKRKISVRRFDMSEFRDKANITEYYLPKACSGFCTGCTNCILKGESTCKDADKIRSIDKSLLEADLIVMTSPAYVFHATGAMKTFLDHFAYRWLPHRPAPEMFGKRAFILTQCLGQGAKSAAKDMKDSLSWWGISKIEVFTGALMSDIVWEKLSEKKQSQLTRKVKRLSRKFAQIDYTKPAHTNLITKVKSKNSRPAPSRGWTAVFLFLQFPNMFIMPEIQTHRNPCKGNHEKQKRCSRAFPLPEQPD